MLYSIAAATLSIRLKRMSLTLLFLQNQGDTYCNIRNHHLSVSYQKQAWAEEGIREDQCERKAKSRTYTKHKYRETIMAYIWIMLWSYQNRQDVVGFMGFLA